MNLVINCVSDLVQVYTCSIQKYKLLKVTWSREREKNIVDGNNSALQEVKKRVTKRVILLLPNLLSPSVLSQLCCLAVNIAIHRLTNWRIEGMKKERKRRRKKFPIQNRASKDMDCVNGQLLHFIPSFKLIAWHRFKYYQDTRAKRKMNSYVQVVMMMVRHCMGLLII